MKKLWNSESANRWFLKAESRLNDEINPNVTVEMSRYTCIIIERD